MRGKVGKRRRRRKSWRCGRWSAIRGQDGSRKGREEMRQEL
jgi:hypothetical protein